MSASNTTTITSVGAPNRRNTELAMLVFAVAIPLFAFANAGLAKHGTVPAGLAEYGLGMGLLAGRPDSPSTAWAWACWRA